MMRVFDTKQCDPAVREREGDGITRFKLTF